MESTLHSIAVNYKSCLVRSNDCETQSNVCFSAPSEAPGYRSLPPPRENTFFLTFSAYRAGLSGELSEDINISVLVHKMKFLKKTEVVYLKGQLTEDGETIFFYLSKGEYIILFPPLF